MNVVSSSGLTGDLRSRIKCGMTVREILRLSISMRKVQDDKQDSGSEAGMTHLNNKGSFDSAALAQDDKSFLLVYFSLDFRNKFF